MTALQKNDLKSFINQKDATGVFKKEGIEGEARRKEKKGKKKKKRREETSVHCKNLRLPLHQEKASNASTELSF